jgi:peptidoglycan/xylan/chitin deacetylase (PgdA/CDA1 family)
MPQRSINLMFHDVKKNPSRWNTLPDQFEGLMQQLKAHENFKDVCLTVDDAGKGNYEYMLPAFEKYGLKATIFVPTQFISKGGNTSTYMTSQQIREFSDLGHIIGSHSHSHPANISLLSKSAINHEWQKSKQILEDITGKEVLSCSIPGGFYSNNQWKILNNLGYTKVFNSVPTYRIYSEKQMELFGRFSIERNITERGFHQLLSYDSFNQKRLFFRQKASFFLNNMKHLINRN